ncbi:MAG: Fic family protein, partial [Acidobacteria bacterium]|nr:Fic family protein [Acidobacteriota bacterium]
LGEARSKCEHIAGVPLKPAVAERLHRLYLAKGVHATTAIEGNTLSEHDAELLLEGKLDVPRSKEYLKREMENIVGACDEILDDCRAGNAFELSVDEICHLNGQVLAGLDVEDHVAPGKLRQVSVGVMNYRGPDWQDVPDLLDRMCRWLSGPEFQRDGEWALPVALLRAVAAHLTKRLGGFYRAKSDKTLTRDLNEVVRLGLVDREGNGYRARVELIDAFLPFRGGMIEPL